VSGLVLALVLALGLVPYVASSECLIAHVPMRGNGCPICRYDSLLLAYSSKIWISVGLSVSVSVSLSVSVSVSVSLSVRWLRASRMPCGS